MEIFKKKRRFTFCASVMNIKKKFTSGVLYCAMFQHNASTLYLRDTTLFELMLLQSYRQLFKKYNPKCKQDSGVHQFSYQTHESSFLMPSKVLFQFYRQKDEKDEATPCDTLVC